MKLTGIVYIQDDGRLEVAVNLSPLCSSKFTIGAPSEQVVTAVLSAAD